MDWYWPQAGDTPPAALVFYYTGKCLQIIPVVLYLIYRSGESWSAFGVVRPRWLGDPAFALLLWVAWYAAYFLVWAVIAATGVDATAVKAGGPDDTITPSQPAFAVVAAFATATGEELVLRGYLIPRFERLLGSRWASVLTTTALFAAYHVYNGISGVVDATILGLILGSGFCLVRRLWPVILAHWLYDVVATFGF